MASKIDKIEIQNFKFFPKMIKPIEVGGKHMLLYGENGSGKSSIYWALYTLLEAANKENDSEIKKYFDPNNDERLLNINLEQGLPETPESYLKIKFLNEADEFNLSFNDTSINKNLDAQKSNFSSDFINYRHLLNLYNFAHSEEIDLFHFFCYAVFPYVKFNPVSYFRKKNDESFEEFSTESATQIYSFLENGPLKNKKTKAGKTRYPIRTEQEYKDFKKITDGFYEDLKTLITYINTEGNPILKEELGSDITFKLIVDRELIVKQEKRYLNDTGEYITEFLFPNTNDKLTPSDFYKDIFALSSQLYTAPKIHIWLKIETYQGQAGQVKKAHSFLNEAKLTAVALAIRLAILKKRLERDESKLKLLVFDDLMISLDMSNREKIINLILNKYIKGYQIFILTHDKVMFEDAKKHIETHYQTEIKRTGLSEAEKAANLTEVKKAEMYVQHDWMFYEMYQASNDSYSFPFLTEHKSSIQKAHYYFKENVDYNACGNNLRTALEEFFREFIPYNYFRDEDNNPIPVKDKTLGVLLEKATTYFNHVGFNTDILLDLERYIKRSLNPLSHYNPTSNYYRKELEDIFQIYYKLNLLRNKPLLEKDSTLKFDIFTTDGNKYTYMLQLMDDIRAYNANDGKPTFLLDKDKRRYGYKSVTINDNEVKRRTGDSSALTLKEFYDETIESLKVHLKKDPVVKTDMLSVYYNEHGVKLVDLLKLA